MAIFFLEAKGPVSAQKQFLLSQDIFPCSSALRKLQILLWEKTSHSHLAPLMSIHAVIWQDREISVGRHFCLSHCCALSPVLSLCLLFHSCLSCLLLIGNFPELSFPAKGTSLAGPWELKKEHSPVFCTPLEYSYLSWAASQEETLIFSTHGHLSDKMSSIVMLSLLKKGLFKQNYSEFASLESKQGRILNFCLGTLNYCLPCYSECKSKTKYQDHIRLHIAKAKLETFSYKME